ncbi:vWA domain-containing protein [Desulfofalx alkaliphila]|uniref:vWA domain-containing protein n=1 Tax=Desulfofalx alkaliphila TaxID=105483 RepID=UPI000B1994F2|nr:VWA domain-containing protein [Desulfofalx alkaliphila]
MLDHVNVIADTIDLVVWGRTVSGILQMKDPENIVDKIDNLTTIVLTIDSTISDVNKLTTKHPEIKDILNSKIFNPLTDRQKNDIFLMSKQNVVYELNERSKLLNLLIDYLNKKLLQVNIRQINSDYFPTVVAYADIVDFDGMPVEVKKEDIYIQDNGKAVDKASVTIIPRREERVRTPVNIHLVFDISSSMKGSPMVGAKEAGIHFLDLINDEKVAVSAFNNNYQSLVSMTNDKELLTEAINGLQSSGGTALYDAILTATESTADAIGRKAIIVLSDGADTNSSASIEEAITAARNSGVTIFAIALGSFDALPLETLALGTGGMVLYTHDPSELKTIYERFNKMVQGEYKITYNAISDGFNERELFLQVNYAGIIEKDKSRYTVAQIPTKEERDMNNE